jgi:alpha-L-fucosidase 2
MYSGKTTPFQIDANFGFAGAVLSMLIVDVEESGPGERTVVLGPAIPEAWGRGNVTGMRLRGDGRVDFGWDGNGLVNWFKSDWAERVKFMDRNGKQIAGS